MKREMKFGYVFSQDNKGLVLRYTEPKAKVFISSIPELQRKHIKETWTKKGYTVICIEASKESVIWDAVNKAIIKARNT